MKTIKPILCSLIFLLFLPSINAQISTNKDIAILLEKSEKDSIAKIERLAALGFHKLINEYRQSKNLSVISWDETLWIATKNHNAWMAEADILSHNQYKKNKYYTGSGPGDRFNYAAGGNSPGGTANTEEFNGSSWTEVGNLNTARKELAERDLFPDFNVGASYGFRQGNMPNGNDRADFLSLKIGINIPLFAESKQKMAISQRHSEMKQQQYALQDKWLTIQAELTVIIADYERAKQQVSLFKTGIVPQAQQTVASMLAGYQVNKVDFLNLVQAQITLYNYQTNLWQTISEAKSAQARLIATVGEDNIYE